MYFRFIHCVSEKNVVSNFLQQLRQLLTYIENR